LLCNHGHLVIFAPQRQSIRTELGDILSHLRCISLLSGDDTVWEHDPVEQLARDSELMDYKYYRFWSCMDTLKEKNMLEELWNSGKAPWKIW
jgi:glucose-1-phosphate cytidylyltransferase